MKRRVILWICLLGWCLNSFGQEAFIDLQFRPVLPGGNISSSFDDWVSGRQSVSYVLCVSDTGDYYIHFDAYHNDHFLLGARFLQRVNNPGCTLYGQSNFNFGDYLEGNVEDVGDPNYLTAVTQYAIRTRTLPAGEFRLCFKVYDRSGFGLLSEDCAEGRMTGFQPPSLISPLGSTHASTQPVLFQWTHASPSSGFTPSVSLNVYEVYPGQTAVQAVEGNIPLITRSISNFNQYYWMPMEMPFYPGDTAHLAWQLQADAPLGIDQADPYGRSEVGEFWIYAPGVPPVEDGGSSPCPLKVNAGQDQKLALSNKEGVRIGTEDNSNCRFEWASDPPGIVSYESQVVVKPAVDTRYVLYKRDEKIGCEVMDEVWVILERPIEASIVLESCDSLVAVPKPKAEAVFGNPKMDCIHNEEGMQFVCNGNKFRFGNCLISSPGLPIETSCDLAVPARVSEPMVEPDEYSYLWSNGSTERGIVPTEAGDYSVTISNSGQSVSASTYWEPSALFYGPFPDLQATRYMKRKDEDNPFVIRQINYSSASGVPCYNARSFRLVIEGENFRRVIEGKTKSGFYNGEIRWDGREAEGKWFVKAGTYKWTITLSNCEFPEWLDDMQYMIEDAPSNVAGEGANGILYPEMRNSGFVEMYW